MNSHIRICNIHFLNTSKKIESYNTHFNSIVKSGIVINKIFVELRITNLAFPKKCIIPSIKIENCDSNTIEKTISTSTTPIQLKLEKNTKSEEKIFNLSGLNDDEIETHMNLVSDLVF